MLEKFVFDITFHIETMLVFPGQGYCFAWSRVEDEFKLSFKVFCRPSKMSGMIQLTNLKKA